MQCCSRGSRQQYIRRNPVQCRLNTLGTTLHRPKPYAMLSELLQTTLHKKILCNVVLIFLEQHCTRKTLCNVVPEAGNNIAQEKISRQCSLNNIWSLCLHNICQALHVKKKKKKVVNQLRLKSQFDILPFYQATSQISSRTLSKQVKLSVSHIMLPKLVQSCFAASLKCRNQDCIRR